MGSEKIFDVFCSIMLIAIVLVQLVSFFILLSNQMFDIRSLKADFVSNLLIKTLLLQAS
jgi:hypothetical protein